uniref:Uncharacterized protein n=1 Tax=Megaselia scalaris TaxID=36166 RepID=T1GHK0_MEGSC
MKELNIKLGLIQISNLNIINNINEFIDVIEFIDFSFAFELLFKPNKKYAIVVLSHAWYTFNAPLMRFFRNDYYIDSHFYIAFSFVNLAYRYDSILKERLDRQNRWSDGLGLLLTYISDRFFIDNYIYGICAEV